jgi:hypothetical protein
VVCLTLNCGAGTKLHSCWPYIPGKKATPLRSPPQYEKEITEIFPDLVGCGHGRCSVQVNQKIGICTRR